MVLRLVAMKLLRVSLPLGIRVGYVSLSLLVLLTFQTFAGNAEQTQLLEALKLGNQGKFSQAVQLLDSLVHSDPAALDDINRGMAWTTLGTLHMLMGDNEQSRQCYENAIRLLRKVPGASRAYARALANLGSLEMLTRQFEDAEVALRKAQEIDRKAADHLGLQEVALYRANLEITRNNTRAARRFLADAFREAEQAKDLSLSDLRYDVQRRRFIGGKSEGFRGRRRGLPASNQFLGRGLWPKVLPRCRRVCLSSGCVSRTP